METKHRPSEPETALDALLEDLPQETEYPKANLVKRFIAHFLDGLVAAFAAMLVGLLSGALGGITGALYFLVRDGLSLDFMDQRSLGKRIMKLRPVRLDGAPMDLEASFRRNWMWALGGLSSSAFFGLGTILGIAAGVIGLYEVYKVVTDPRGRRLGDEMAGTQVIEVDA